MRFISTRVHGVLDYMTGVLLLVSPWLFGFAIGGAAQWIPVIIGAMILLMSILTAYELGISKQIPMETHLSIDAVGGILLGASPWIFGFSHEVFWPHLIFGLFELLAALCTQSTPASYDKKVTRSGTSTLK